MTVSQAAATSGRSGSAEFATPASVAMLLAMVDMVKRKDYPSGVLGIFAAPEHVEAEDLEHDGQVVRIRPAESALAVREALREHVDGQWTVIVTDRDDQDLGAGILTHFVGSQLRRPNAWEAVRHTFGATGVAPALSSGPGNRALANALLAARPADGWPSAPAGVLTRGHAMTSVARVHLGLADDVMDAITVLSWSVLPESDSALHALREAYGDPLADALVDWMADSTGPAAGPIGTLLRVGATQDLVPLGLALHLITADSHNVAEAQVAKLAAVRLEQPLGKPLPHRDALVAHATAAVAVLADLARTERNDAHVNRVLARADAILGALDATPLAIHSDVLTSGFRQRLELLGAALVRAVSQHAAGDSTTDASQAVENAWALCLRHRLAQRRTPEALAFDGAVKLWRWMTSPEVPADADLADRVRAHLDHGAWADLAVNDVDTGVDDPELTAVLRAVYEAAMKRRGREEREFATALAAATAADVGPTDGPGTLTGVGSSPPDGEPVWYVESLLRSFVIPMARRTPVLLVVMDGMSAASSIEIMADVTSGLGWVEAGVHAGATRRAAALTALPSLTEVSRASLLCGALQTGGQDLERAGYAALTGKAGKIRAELFHKKGIDTTRPGALVAEGVGAALDDTTGTPLVTVVLNTIDDALDRSDPLGTVWNADSVKHLTPLLARARAGGRTVIVTADHGHVVERRRGTQRFSPDMTSGRSRAPAGPVHDDEVAVEGRRVLTDDHRAVLAVRESLRYGPLKAGYHGGASAQEVVVPVIVLLPDEATNPLDLPLLPPQAPIWWSMSDSVPTSGGNPWAPVAPESSSQPSGIRHRPGRGRAPVDSGPTLFDQQLPTGDDVAPAASLGSTIVASDVYQAQRKMLSRLPIRDAQVAALLDALDAAPGNRLPRAVAAATLGVPAFRVDGAVSQVRQLVNIEGYNVIGLDADGQTIVLDLGLLRDQFGFR